MTKLPDAEKLCEQIVAELKPRIGPKSAMVGLYTGGAWLAERLHPMLQMKSPLGLMDIAFYRDDYGRPASISLVVLADRGGRQLPICAQYVGARVEVPSGMRLRLKQEPGGKLVLVLEPERAA